MGERRQGRGRRESDQVPAPPQRYGWLRTIPTTNLLVVSVIIWYSFCLLMWAATVFLEVAVDPQALGIMVAGSIGQALSAALHYKAYRDTWQKEYPHRD
jgi:hypothetical protein